MAPPSQKPVGFFCGCDLEVLMCASTSPDEPGLFAPESDQAHVVAFVVHIDLSIDEFDKARQREYTRGVAASLGVRDDDVIVRAARAGSVIVDTHVQATSAAAAAAVASVLSQPDVVGSLVDEDRFGRVVVGAVRVIPPAAGIETYEGPFVTATVDLDDLDDDGPMTVMEWTQVVVDLGDDAPVDDANAVARGADSRSARRVDWAKTIQLVLDDERAPPDRDAGTSRPPIPSEPEPEVAESAFIAIPVEEAADVGPAQSQQREAEAAQGDSVENQADSTEAPPLANEPELESALVELAADAIASTANEQEPEAAGRESVEPATDATASAPEPEAARGQPAEVATDATASKPEPDAVEDRSTEVAADATASEPEPDVIVEIVADATDAAPKTDELEPEVVESQFIEIPVDLGPVETGLRPPLAEALHAARRRQRARAREAAWQSPSGDAHYAHDRKERARISSTRANSPTPELPPDPVPPSAGDGRDASSSETLAQAKAGALERVRMRAEARRNKQPAGSEKPDSRLASSPPPRQHQGDETTAASARVDDAEGSGPPSSAQAIIDLRREEIRRLRARISGDGP